jgi:hypothetical protein
MNNEIKPTEKQIYEEENAFAVFDLPLPHHSRSS